MLRRLLGLRVEHEAAMLVECSEGDGQVEPIVLSAWQPRVFYATVVACTCQGHIFECIVHLQAIFLDDGDDDDILLYLITDIGLFIFLHSTPAISLTTPELIFKDLAKAFRFDCWCSCTANNILKAPCTMVL